MKMFTITATPVQSEEQMIKNGYSLDEENTVDHINNLHLLEYPEVVAKEMAKVGFDGFTLYKVHGYWQGVPETSFKIEIAVDTDPERVYTVAKALRDIYNQDAVMLTLPNNNVRFV